MQSSRVSARLRWIVVALVYVAITLAYSRTLLPVIGSALPNDTGDPGLNTWILWWNAHALPLTERWWNGPIFYPIRGTMAFSETFLNLWPVSSPLQWAGASAVLTYNVLFLLSFPAAAAAAHALARRLTGRHDAGLIAGLAYGFAPYRAAQMPHLQTLWSCWMPLGLLALHRFLARESSSPGLAGARPRVATGFWDLALFGLCWLMNGLATGYFLFFFSVLVGLWVLWFARSLRDWLMIALAIALASLPLAPLLLGYYQHQSAVGVTRTMSEIEFFSADLSAVWATSAYLLPRLWTVEPRPEGELYPGATILILAIAGSVVAWRRASPQRRYLLQWVLFGLAALLAAVALYAWLNGPTAFRLLGVRVSLSHPARTAFLAFGAGALALCWNSRLIDAWRRRSALLFYTVSAGLMLLLALGPHARFLGTTFWVQAPYYWLMQLPGGHAFRVPARFAMLFALCLAVAAALAFARMAAGRARAALAAVVCLAIGVEGFVIRMGVAEVPRPLSLAGLDRGAVMLELPMVDVFSDTAAMLRATQVGYTLVNGFSGYSPPHYGILSEGVAALDASVLTAFRSFGSLLIFVHGDRDPEGRYQEFVAGVPGAYRVRVSAEGTLYQLPGLPRPQRTPANPLPIAAVSATINDRNARQMIDGDPRSRWDTLRHQTAGDEVRIVLDRPAVLDAVELTLGSFSADYPRRLRVSAVTDAAREIVWEGATAGLALNAALSDPATIPVVIDLDSKVRAGELVLTVVDGHDDNAWSIAEVRVFGE